MGGGKKKRGGKKRKKGNKQRGKPTPAERVASISATSLAPGDTLTVRVEDVSGYKNMNIGVSKISDDFDMSAFSMGRPPTERTGGLEVCMDAKTLSTHGPGLYMVTTVRLLEPTAPNGTAIPLVRAPEPLLFEIRDGEQTRCSAELAAKRQEILKARASVFNAGIGKSDGKETFRAFVFVRDCLLRTPMHFDQVELLPLPGMSCGDELESMQGFLKRIGLPVLADEKSAIERHRHETPGVVLHFPRVLADSADEAMDVLAAETRAVCDTLSLFRGSYAAPFAEVLWQPDKNLYHYRLLSLGYRGNLLGGGLAGESPQNIRATYRATKSSPQIQLYLSLYRDALAEERVEFRYFRLWSLLETIARANGYVGAPLLDWNDDPILNASGMPRFVQGQAEELVLELLRRVFRAGNIGKEFGSGVAVTDIEDLVPIWYRHRNCVGHSGGCLPNDPSVCKPNSPKHVTCRAAHDEICRRTAPRDIYNDGYIKALMSVVKIVIGRQTSDYLRSRNELP